jgi:tetratricopeptide (TPR) repeat protein
MIRLFFALCIGISTSLLASDVIKTEDSTVVSNETNQTQSTLRIRYLEAKQYYTEKKYSAAYAILSEIYLDALDDPELNFYLARCAYEVGDFPIAIAAFERVEMLDPNNVRNQLELARTKYYLHLYPEAEDGFKKILQNPSLPQNVRLNVEYYLSSIAKEMKRIFLYTTLKAGILYDSNVNFASSDSTYTLPFLGTFNTPSELSDFAHEEMINIVHVKDIMAKDGMMIRNQFNVYNRQYFDETAYDLRVLSYNPALIYNTQSSSYELIGGIERVNLGARKYSVGYSLQPKWIYSYLPSLKQTLALKVGTREYFQKENSALDCQNLEANGGLEYYLSPSSALRADLIYTHQAKESGNRIDVDFDEIAAAVLYTDQLRPTTIMQASLGLRKRSYNDYSTLFEKYRTDESTSVGFNLTERLNRKISLELSGNYSHTDSTISIYSYDKLTLALGVSARF